jgi:micrococcal nuclease
MKKSAALMISVLLVFLIALDLNLFSSNSQPRENLVVSRVIDGDTLVLEDDRTIRLLNINSPEKSSPLSNISIDFMKNFVNHTIEVEIIGQDKYKRYLARLYTPYYLNLELVRQGFASKFLVDESELREFSDAEDYAVNNGRGIWKKSPYFGCFSSKIDYLSEKIILNNNCINVDLFQWQLKDESRKIFIFSSIYFNTITIHSSQGIDNSTDIYWNSKESIWNNDRDTLYLFDNQGGLVHHESYGY